MNKTANRRRIAAAYWTHNARVFVGLMCAVARTDPMRIGNPRGYARSERLDQAFSRRVRVAAS